MRNNTSDPFKAELPKEKAEVFALQLEITGQVQGVGFREWLIQTAAELQLAGWVRNRADGSVEAHVEGSQLATMQMTERCWKGPSAARVDSVKMFPVEPEHAGGFIRHPDV